MSLLWVGMEPALGDVLLVVGEGDAARDAEDGEELEVAVVVVLGDEVDELVHLVAGDEVDDRSVVPQQLHQHVGRVEADRVLPDHSPLWGA